MNKKLIKSSQIKPAAEASAAPKILISGIFMSIKQSEILIIEDIKPNKKGVKVLPDEYITVKRTLVRGAKTKIGEANISIDEYAQLPNIREVSCFEKAIIRAHNNRDTQNIIRIIFDKKLFSKNSFFSAKCLAEIGKRETESVLKRPAGKRIIVMAYPKNAP